MFANIFKYILKKPKLVVLVDKDYQKIREVTEKLLRSSLRVKKEVLFTDRLREKDLVGKECLIVNSAKEDIKKLKDNGLCKVLTFGFKEDSDVWVSDLRQNGDTSFKINYEGKSVPVWLKSSSLDEVNSVLVAISIGIFSGLNLVEISQILGSYREN